ncbi:LysE family translocator [Nonomuraea cavernae]|uniref:Lysine transporter LysE n=1 Tax=Nonomuraea cavernae TaxID=2045107 RepID=A0A917Z2E0_9ACTN|nr:LysE family translocator [Nonomuraea cavernae]MCA2188147.1 LysE family translocator [Nonomuraea cavernae]GGO72932.1 lysine transporter LysE [Nonomuraea cavernae]
MTALIAFIGVSVVVICTPGPDTVLTVRNAFSGGGGSGVWTAAGVALGQAVWTVAASLGVAGLIQASEPAFLVLKYAGVAYLCYLGLQSLRSAWRGGGLLTFAWLALYSLAIDRARAWFARSAVRRTLDALSGLLLLAFGARLAFTDR